MPVLCGGHNLPLMVEIELTNLPKSGGAMDGTPGTPRDDRPALLVMMHEITEKIATTRILWI